MCISEDIYNYYGISQIGSIKILYKRNQEQNKNILVSLFTISLNLIFFLILFIEGTFEMFEMFEILSLKFCLS